MKCYINARFSILFSLFIILSSACENSFFVTTIVEDRSSFIKFYSIEGGNTNNDDKPHAYLTKIKNGFLLSTNPSDYVNVQSLKLSEQGEKMEYSSPWGSNAVHQFNQIIAIDEGENGYYCLAEKYSNSWIIKMTANNGLPVEFKKSYEIPSSRPIDMDILPNGNIVILSNGDNNFTTIITLIDSDFNLIWQRNFSLKDKEIQGTAIQYIESRNDFLILGTDNKHDFFVLELNSSGNEVNLRFASEFGLPSLYLLSSLSDKYSFGLRYYPALIETPNHYLIIERGKRDISREQGVVYKLEKDLSNISILNSTSALGFLDLQSVQKLGNEILIAGIEALDSNVTIKKMNFDGELLNWESTGEDKVTFNTNITSLEDGGGEPIFIDTGTFIAGNIVKTSDGGYAMSGVLEVPSDGDFVQVATIFKIRSDGSY